MTSSKRLVVLGRGTLILGVFATAIPAHAQSKEARGTVTAVTESTISMKAGAEQLTFYVDSDTHLDVRTAERDLQKAQPGKPSPRVNNFFEPGQAVLVRYREEKGRNHALDITRISSAGGNGGSVSDPAKVSEGKVKLVTDSQLVLDAGGREMSFAINGDTNVLAKGATKATKAAGGTTAITTVVHSGDKVSVTYHEAGAKMTASEVRVRVASR
jgi:hypothetical protein